MNKERDLLPWIFGGLSAAAIAVAFATVSTHRAAPTLAPQVVAAQAPASPTALPIPTTAQGAPQAAPLAGQPDSAANPSPPQTQAAVEPEVQAGQIWECMTKGVKTFSNNPCGEKSTLLDVGPINTMSPPPAMRYVRSYGPGYTDQSASADTEDYSDQYAADTGGNSYTYVGGVGLLARRRPENIHRPPSQPSPPSRPPPPAHQNPAPVRRN
jgi:hypothetical protein